MNSIHPVLAALRLRFAFVLLPVFLAAASQPALAATPSTQFSLDGFLNAGTPASFNLADLESFAASQPGGPTSVSVANSSGGTDVYTGVSLNSFLNAYIKTDPTVPKNDILRDYVVATGTDGYKAVYSLGELNTGFGNQNDIIAYQLNGVDLTTSGFARIVAPADVKAGRWVSNLASLDVGHVDYTAGQGGVSSQFTITGQVSNPGTYDLSNLPPGSLTPSTVTVTSQPASLAGTTFTGVSLWSLLNLAGIITDPNVKNDILGKYVIATGTDGYQAVFSLGELNPNFGNQPDLLAYDNAPGVVLGSDGFARIVVPNDGKGGRYVSNLVSLEVLGTTPVPLPPSALLMGSSLLALGFGRFRRRLPGSGK